MRFIIRTLFILSSVFVGTLATQAWAGDVGIQFDQMPVGTEWVIQRHDDDKRRYAYTYVGKQGAEYQLRIESVNKGGARKTIAKRYFDSRGRMLRSESHRGEIRRYKPFDCQYAVGSCTHAYNYPLLPKNGKPRRRTMTDRFENRLEGDTLIVVRVKSNGGHQEFPFRLGKYRIRVANEYTNALGKRRGFSVLEINEPK